MTQLQLELVATCLWTALGFALLCFVVGQVTGNVSQVDKLWSIVPVVYCWIVTIGGGFDGPTVLVALLVTAWGARLTYNFSRQGGYAWPPWRGEEDYRWTHVRRMPVIGTRVGWPLFNLGFICLVQHAILVGISLPIVLTVGHRLTWWDAVLAAVFVLLLVLETAADQQQWRFQNEKKRRLAAGETLNGRYADGFVHDGLWTCTRHPNYLAEQSMWIVVWLFGVVDTHRIDWSITGVVVLLLLFQGSSSTSEGLQAAKYPTYAGYRRRTPRFLPWPKAAVLGRGRDDEIS